LLITLPFRFWLSFLKPLSNNPVHDLPICSGELGRQKARFCCLGCKVARFPVLDVTAALNPQLFAAEYQPKTSLFSEAI
jgi:hypothetical protein